MNLQEKADKTLALKANYLNLYENQNYDNAKKVELEYLDLRRELLTEIDDDIARQRSIPMSIIKKRVYEKVRPKRIETGIHNLDMELVDDAMHMRGEKGGLALGNFIQLAGSKGTGKSTIMLKIITGFSNYERVSWFDFEMGEDRVVKKLEDFTYDDENVLYYSASRLLSDVVDEVKILNASGVKHFVVDSAMKIRVKTSDRYEKFSTISSELSELTSSLGINIYMINQMSQTAEREGHLSIKHGNDAEYDADFMFFILSKPETDESGDVVVDDMGIPKVDENSRYLKCTKNRQDERLFTVEIPKYQILGSKPVEIVYEKAS